MWTDHLWGFHCYFNIIHVKAPALADTAWAQGRRCFNSASAKKKKKTKHKTQGLWQVSALTNPQKGEREGGSKKKKNPALFNCGTSIKASKWGRLGGTLAHQTDTPNTHHLYAGLLKKERSKFLKMKRGLFPAFIPPQLPFTHSLFFFFFFY